MAKPYANLNNDEKILHEGMEAMPLCREHHTECHTIGQQTFLDKYHFDGGVVIDKSIAVVYGLNKRRKKNA